MAKKNRKRNRAIAAAVAAQNAAKEQELPPPPEAVTPPESVAQATEGVREQQLGMWAQQTFEQEAKNEADRRALQERIDAFNAEQSGYETAYGRAGADSPEERGAVIARERTIKLVVGAVGAVLLAKALGVL